MKILLASFNPHKISEIRDIFRVLSQVELILPADIGCSLQAEESGASYFENALLKAQAYRPFCQYPILADDSGLEIACWNKQPGIYSARFLGEETSYQKKNEEIIALLEKEKERSAQFVAVAVLLALDGEARSFEGRVDGSIAYRQKGQNGFGYDPLFMLSDGRTMAELSSAEKNLISHRALAFQQVVAYIKEQMHD